MADNPRTPKSLQGLLKFCLEATKSEDVQSTSQFKAMTDEDKQFIQDAMRAAMGKDPVKQMVEYLEILINGVKSEEDLEKHKEALEDLHDYCEDLDLANDFHKIGGYQVLPSLLNSPSPDIRWRAADLVGTLVQNNPYSQEKVLQNDFLPLLLQKLDKDEDDMVRTKMLYAVSCLCRSYEPAKEEFLKHHGFSVLLRAMQTQNEKLQTKSAFLLASLSSDQPNLKDMLFDMGFIEQLIGLLYQEHGMYHEHLMSALLNLTNNFPRGVTECQRPELQLRKLLEERIQFLKGKEEFMEELEHCQALLKICFSDSNTESSADR